MRLAAFFFCFVLIYSNSIAQTPIDDLQKQNLKYLELQESDGYEFRSQIITEFDNQNASQDVNIKLDANFTYIVVALGDKNIPKVDLEVRPEKKATIQELSDVDSQVSGKSYTVKPNKSGRYKISINVSGLDVSKKGFISFMVLRK